MNEKELTGLTDITIQLDSNSLERIEALAKGKGKNIHDEIVYLLEKGIDIQ
jgi:hypothetical protein